MRASGWMVRCSDGTRSGFPRLEQARDMASKHGSWLRHRDPRSWCVVLKTEAVGWGCLSGHGRRWRYA